MSKTVSGVLQVQKNGNGFLRDPAKSFKPRQTDPIVPRPLIRQYGFQNGVALEGPSKSSRGTDELTGVDTAGGMSPDDFAKRKRFSDLTTINPEERFNLSVTSDLTGRMLDLVAPIGLGTRGLIVSPPRAGKTMLLESIARGIRQSHPDARVIILLVDERPEEVTHFRRQVDAEVFASSNDEELKSHINLIESVMAHIKCELECGRNIVVLMDSLTRMARAYNLNTTGRGRTMSGGIDANALETPRRFFGLARNIEDGGSITIIATALVDTGSRMDQHIFEEFKGTGNSEIILDRALANERIWPAININESGTRREELLFSEEEMEAVNRFRRELSGLETGRALLLLRDQLKKCETNAEFIASLK